MTKERIAGYDIARGFAIFGMVLVNFRLSIDTETTGMLYQLLSLIDGRASSVFVVLAGIGVHFLYQKLDGDLKRCQIILCYRAAFLAVLGFLLLGIWPADILHFYSLYLIIASLCVAQSTKNLPLIALGVVFSFPLLVFLIDYDAGWNWDSLSYEGLFTWQGLIRHSLYNGFHPVIPWVGFLIAGIWLGRQDFSQPLLRIRLATRALGVFLIVELSAIFFGKILRSIGTDQETASFFNSTEILPPMPFYMLSSGATAFLLIILCCGLPAYWKNLLTPFEKIGKMALTLYVAHIFLGLGILESLGYLEKKSLPAFISLVAGVIFIITAMIFAALWFRRYKTGPIENLMRRLSG